MTRASTPLGERQDPDRRRAARAQAASASKLSPCAVASQRIHSFGTYIMLVDQAFKDRAAELAIEKGSSASVQLKRLAARRISSSPAGVSVWGEQLQSGPKFYARIGAEPRPSDEVSVDSMSGVSPCGEIAAQKALNQASLISNEALITC